MRTLFAFHARRVADSEWETAQIRKFIKKELAALRGFARNSHVRSLRYPYARLWCRACRFPADARCGCGRAICAECAPDHARLWHEDTICGS